MSWAAATPGWSQPAVAAPQPKNRRAPLSHGPTGAVQQQPGGTGRADDEIEAENLRRIPLHGRGDGFCRDPLAAFDGQEAGLAYTAYPDSQPGQPDRRSQGCVTRPRPGLLQQSVNAIVRGAGDSGHGFRKPTAFLATGRFCEPPGSGFRQTIKPRRFNGCSVPRNSPAD